MKPKLPDYVFLDTSFSAPGQEAVTNGEIRIRLFANSGKPDGPRVTVDLSLDDTQLGHLLYVLKRAKRLRRERIDQMIDALKEIP